MFFFLLFEGPPDQAEITKLTEMILGSPRLKSRGVEWFGDGLGVSKMETHSTVVEEGTLYAQINRLLYSWVNISEYNDRDKLAELLRKMMLYTCVLSSLRRI